VSAVAAGPDAATATAALDLPDLGAWFAAEPFSVPQADKERALLADLNRLTAHHRRACAPYARVLDAFGHGVGAATSVAGVPMLPVRAFKTHRLASVPDDEVFKTLTSSGTTGAAVSRILLDKGAAALQTKALAHTMRAVLGRDRLPMLLADSAAIVKDRRSFSARGAGP
jgi:Acyl-protein synthetase, LuxE